MRCEQTWMFLSLLMLIVQILPASGKLKFTAWFTLKELSNTSNFQCLHCILKGDIPVCQTIGYDKVLSATCLSVDKSDSRCFKKRICKYLPQKCSYKVRFLCETASNRNQWWIGIVAVSVLVLPLLFVSFYRMRRRLRSQRGRDGPGGGDPANSGRGGGRENASVLVVGDQPPSYEEVTGSVNIAYVYDGGMSRAGTGPAGSPADAARLEHERNERNSRPPPINRTFSGEGQRDPPTYDEALVILKQNIDLK